MHEDAVTPEAPTAPRVEAGRPVGPRRVLVCLATMLAGGAAGFGAAGLMLLRQRTRLRRTTDMLRLAVETMDQGMIVLDAEDRVLLANRRAEAFAKAGADILFVESPESEAEMEAIGRAFHQPLLINMVEGGRTPILPRARLAELGFQVVIYPAAGFLATSAVLDAMYRHLTTTGSSLDAPVPVFDFKKLTEIMGFPEVHAFERRWAETA